MSQPLENSLLSKSLVGGREDFINRVIPDPNSHPNIVGFCHLAVGLAMTNKQFIISEDSHLQRSFRIVLLEAMEGMSNGKARVLYVDVRKCEQNEEKNLLEYVEKLRMEFNSILGRKKEFRFTLQLLGMSPYLRSSFNFGSTLIFMARGFVTG